VMTRQVVADIGRRQSHFLRNDFHFLCLAST
jgi:hypothetical protein